MKRFITLFSFLMLLCGYAIASGTQPGNWRWKNANGSNFTTGLNAGVGLRQEATLYTAADVVTLRVQIYSGTVGKESLTNGRLFLQYFDAGIPGSGVAGVDKTMYFNNGVNAMPPSNQRQTDQSTSNTSWQGAFDSRAQTNGWRTIADFDAGNFSYSTDTNNGTGSATTTSTNSAFIMSDAGYNGTPINPADYNANTFDNTRAKIGGGGGAAYGSTDAQQYMQLGSPNNGSYSSISASSTGTAYFIFPRTNGFPDGLPESLINNILGQYNSNYSRVLVEFEFHIKCATNPTASNLAPLNKYGVLQGHRYYFRLRGFGTSENNSNNTGYSSADGGGSGSGNYTNTNVGDYKSLDPYPHLQISNDFYARTLPVALSAFDAKLNNGRVDLAWQTASEIGNKGFEILKGINSNNLQSSKFVTSKAASNGGNSSTPLSYTSTDSFPVNNTNNYYQLKQLDLDGNSSTSDIRSVYVTGATTSLTFGPNPAISILNINNLKSGSNIRIINLNGQVVKSQVVSSNTTTVDIAKLPSGVYIAEVYNLSGIKEVHKFIKK